jgi:O-acetyl-ADP-ribose deacetylase (regulator of RNase III)
LRLAVEHRLRTIAFPAISTGAYAYPLKPAATIAIDTVRKVTRQETTLEEVIFCCYSREDFAVYKKAFEG